MKKTSIFGADSSLEYVVMRSSPLGERTLFYSREERGLIGNSRQSSQNFSTFFQLEKINHFVKGISPASAGEIR